MSNAFAALGEILGRLHLLVLHFPIALILAAAAVELAGNGSRRPAARRTARTCLGLGAAAAAVAATTGWLHAEHVAVGRALERTLTLHRWFGVSTAALALWTWRASRAPRGGFRRQRRGYAGGLVLASALVALTAHFGGTLVHGRGYLFGAAAEERAPRPPSVAPADEHGAVDFDRDLRPILAARCYECHGEKRQKGKLRLDRMAEVLAEPGQAIVVPGRPDLSEIVRRVELPQDDEDAMPAEGEPLTAGEIATLRAWIAAGARVARGAAAPEGVEAR